mgnify:CR=1 FL=1
MENSIKQINMISLMKIAAGVRISILKMLNKVKKKKPVNDMQTGA